MFTVAWYDSLMPENADFHQLPGSDVGLESLSPKAEVAFPINESEWAQGPARIALIYREILRRRYHEDKNNPIFQSQSFCLIGLDVFATANVLASMESERKKYPHKQMKLELAMFDVAPRVAHHPDGTSDYNRKVKPLLFTSADGKYALKENEVSVDEARGLLAQIILFDQRVFGISCNSAGLLHYLHDAVLLVTVASEQLRADAEEFLYHHGVTLYDLRLDSGATPFSGSEQALLQRFNELLDQRTSEVNAQQPSGPYDPPPRMVRNFVRHNPDGTIDPTDVIGLEILQKILVKIPLSGLQGRTSALDSTVPGQVSRHSGIRLGKDFVVIDNLFALSAKLDEELRLHPERKMPLALGTMLTMTRLHEDRYVAWQRAKQEDLDLLQEFAPLSQEIIWRFKVSHNEKHPPEVFSWYKAKNLKDKVACYRKFAELLRMLHQHKVEKVLLVCTELPVLWDIFKKNRLLRRALGIYWELPEVVDPTPSVIEAAMNFMADA